MKRFPVLLSGRGPTISIATRRKGTSMIGSGMRGARLAPRGEDDRSGNNRGRHGMVAHAR